MLSARNLHHAKVVNSFGLNIYDLLYHDQLVLSRAAADELEQLLGAQNGGAAENEPGEEAAETKQASNEEEAA